MANTYLNRKYVVFFLYCVMIVMCNQSIVTASQCKKLSSCSCNCDGNIIDLKDLANKAGGDPRTHRLSTLLDDGDPWAPKNLLTPEQKKSTSWTPVELFVVSAIDRFKDYAATNPDDQYKYSYNPCEPFSETAAGTWEDHCYAVAGCQVIDQAGSFQFYDIGVHDTVQFSTGTDNEKDVIIASYTSIDGGRHTDVILQCSDGSTTFEAYGENADKPAYYRFILRSPYCCFDSGGLSAGSVLIIIAVVLLNVYVISGVLYNAVRNKASGAGLFTHVLVCKALPGLVKDGSVFLFSGCRRLPYQSVK